MVKDGRNTQNPGFMDYKIKITKTLFRREKEFMEVDSEQAIGRKILSNILRKVTDFLRN